MTWLISPLPVTTQSEKITSTLQQYANIGIFVNCLILKFQSDFLAEVNRSYSPSWDNKNSTSRNAGGPNLYYSQWRKAWCINKYWWAKLSEVSVALIIKEQILITWYTNADEVIEYTHIQTMGRQTIYRDFMILFNHIARPICHSQSII